MIPNYDCLGLLADAYFCFVLAADNQTVDELRHDIELYKQHTASLEHENHTLRAANKRLLQQIEGAPGQAGGAQPVANGDSAAAAEGGREGGWAGGGSEVGRAEAGVPAKRELEGGEGGGGLEGGVDEKRVKVA